MKHNKERNLQVSRFAQHQQSFRILSIDRLHNHLS